MLPNAGHASQQVTVIQNDESIVVDRSSTSIGPSRSHLVTPGSQGAIRPLSESVMCTPTLLRSVSVHMIDRFAAIYAGNTSIQPLHDGNEPVSKNSANTRARRVRTSSVKCMDIRTMFANATKATTGTANASVSSNSSNSSQNDNRIEGIGHGNQQVPVATNKTHAGTLNKRVYSSADGPGNFQAPASTAIARQVQQASQLVDGNESDNAAKRQRVLYSTGTAQSAVHPLNTPNTNAEHSVVRFEPGPSQVPNPSSRPSEARASQPRAFRQLTLTGIASNAANSTLTAHAAFVPFRTRALDTQHNDGGSNNDAVSTNLSATSSSSIDITPGNGTQAKDI